MIALQQAMIPYTPEELITLANKEFAWCDKEMLRASGEMGFVADWKKALEAVKNKYVEPGQMINLVRDLSHEAFEKAQSAEVQSAYTFVTDCNRITGRQPTRRISTEAAPAPT